MELILPASLTTTLQLYADVVTAGVHSVGAAVGSPYSGSASGNVYTYAIPASGDYWGELIIGSSAQPKFAVRDDKAYFIDWGLLDMITLTDAVVVANVTQPTAAKERLVDPIIIGDDYLASVGRNFEWQVNAISNYTAADLSCRWGGKKDGVGWLVSGTVTTITGGISLKFDLPKTATADLEPGYYAWSVEVYTTVGGIEVTRVVGKQPVQLVEKQT